MFADRVRLNYLLHGHFLSRLPQGSGSSRARLHSAEIARGLEGIVFALLCRAFRLILSRQCRLESSLITCVLPAKGGRRGETLAERFMGPRGG